jgi:hypothetical protein
MPKKFIAGDAGSKPPRRSTSGPSYSVGYGKPPVHSRFAPGASGNPKGRPKGCLNLETELKNELNRIITIREGEVSRRLRKGTAWLVKTVNGALNNDPKANATLISLLRTFVLGQQFEESSEPVLTANDEGLLADYLRRHGVEAYDLRENDETAEPKPKDSNKPSDPRFLDKRRQ